MEGYYYKPRVDWDILARAQYSIRRHRHDRDASAATYSRRCSTRRFEQACSRAKPARLQDIFGRDNLFIEIQDHGIPEQRADQPAAARDRPQASGRRCSQPTTAITRTNATPRVPRRAALCPDGLADVRSESVQVPAATEHYLKTAPRCDTPVRRGALKRATTRCGSPSGQISTIEFGNPQLPISRLARGFRRPTRAYLRHLTLEGSEASAGATRLPAVVDRLDYELKVIDDMGFSAYFLITWDLIKLRTRQGNPRVGPGRGSAAGCAVAYCLRITDLDPIRVRPAVRALPQPVAGVDARHRHGLRLPIPRRHDPLRGRALRPRPRRPDRHVQHDQGRGPRYATRRGCSAIPYAVGDKIAKAMPPLDHGSRHAAVVLLRANTNEKYADGYKMAAPANSTRGMVREGLPRPRPSQDGRRRRRRAGGPAAPATASTPPRW